MPTEKRGKKDDATAAAAQAQEADGPEPTEAETTALLDNIQNLFKKKAETPMGDRFKIPEWKESDAPASFLVEKSSFVVMFPRAREPYLTEQWTAVRQHLYSRKIAATLDLVNGTMTVETTSKTWDPYAIVKARDFIELLARYVPIHAAARVLEDDVTSDIIHLDALVPAGPMARSRYLKRRHRLVGPHNKTLQALEILTECYIGIAGSTIAVIGSWRGVREVGTIVERCFAKNVHPYYELKRLLVKRELLMSESPEVQSADWQPFLPEYHKKKGDEKPAVAKASKKRAAADMATPKAAGADAAPTPAAAPAEAAGTRRARERQAAAAKTALPAAPAPRKDDLALASGREAAPVAAALRAEARRQAKTSRKEDAASADQPPAKKSRKAKE